MDSGPNYSIHIKPESNSEHLSCTAPDVSRRQMTVSPHCSSNRLKNTTINSENIIKNMLNDHTFWRYYKVQKAIANRHCILNSIVICLTSMNIILFDCVYMWLVSAIRNHCEKFSSWYTSSVKYISKSVFLHEMELYISHGIFNLSFTNIVPQICANILGRYIFSIDVLGNDTYFVYTTVPRCGVEHECSNVNVSQNNHDIVIIRNGDHYDACCRPIIDVKSPAIDIFDTGQLDAHLVNLTARADVGPISTQCITRWLDVDSVSTDHNVPMHDSIHLNTSTNESNTSVDPLYDIKKFRVNHPKNILIGHYNVNSIRYKFIELEEILNEQYLDIFAIAETRLDDSFGSQFNKTNYKLHRLDRNTNGGGIMLYINDSIAHRIITEDVYIPNRDVYVKTTGTYAGIEYITILCVIKGRKWYLCYVYRPPKTNVQEFCDLLSAICDMYIVDDNLFMAFGDLNIDMNVSENSLTDICHVYGLFNLIKQPTCFKAVNPTLIDVILTNKPKCFSGTFNLDLGSSDFHNCVGAATRAFAPQQPKQKITYRSLKKFSATEFENDLKNVPFHVCEIFDDVSDSYWMHEKLYLSVLDLHAPVKFKTISKNQSPYMNSALRKAMYQRNMWRNKHFHNKNDKYNRTMYVKWRNTVVKLRKHSIREYFSKRCGTGHGGKDFYKTVKPFLSGKDSSIGSKIILKEHDAIVSEPLDIAEIFNTYYASIADYKSLPDGLDNCSFNDVITKHATHSSIIRIRSRSKSVSGFAFSMITPECVLNYVKQLKNNKSVGYDNIQPIFLKVSGENTYQSFSRLFNLCISSCSFPDSMKMSEISPVFKKNDNLCKENYRSINILTMMSKVYERILSDQLTRYFNDLLESSLSAYRSGYSCQHVLLQLTEYWRRALDTGDVVGTIAMDLSKAFDTMPHGLLIAKLHAYGVHESACKLLACYLRNRLQKVRVSGQLSGISMINRGVPQGSVLGPLLFNIFINDLFYTDINSQICNYADDNHLCTASKSVSCLRDVLEKDSHQCIEWFKDNRMEANPSKFQVIAMDRDGAVPLSISVQGNTLQPSNIIKVLGISLQPSLKFDHHVANICIKASRQINVLKQLSQYLNQANLMLLYKSFVASKFHYCPLSWMFCGKKNSEKLEKIQERALRFVYSDFKSDYSTLLRRDNMLSLARPIIFSSY